MQRISQATLRRLARLDAPLRAERQRAGYVIALHAGYVAPGGAAQFTKAQRTILSWPHIPSSPDELAEWERRSAEQQDRLIAASHEDRELRAKLNPAPPIIGKDPADRTGAYRNQMIIMPVPQYPGAENR